jgi:ABC-2 type transport system ATP-binding protein
MTATITVQKLSKTFHLVIPREGVLGGVVNLFYRKKRELAAVKELSFEIAAGDFVGFIGPNGAGKSTTIKMLTGILTPSGGQIEVAGLTPHKQRKELASKIGVVFGQRTQLWWDLPVRDSFDLLKHIYRVPEKEFKERLKLFRDLLELDSFMESPVRKLSLGQRMRADLVASLLHNPDILFLDEPTIGLDVNAKDGIRSFLKTLNREHNKTVLLTTHDLKDIEVLCRRLMIIDHGQLLYDGGIDELKQQYINYSRLTLSVEDVPALKNLLPENCQITEESTSRLSFDLPRSVATPAHLLTDLLAKIKVNEISIEEPQIEDVIRLLYGKDNRE